MVFAIAVMSIFETNAAELNKLAENVREGAKRRGESAEQLEAWKKAARTFHESYDRLAFPGAWRRSSNYSGQATR